MRVVEREKFRFLEITSLRDGPLVTHSSRKAVGNRRENRLERNPLKGKFRWPFLVETMLFSGIHQIVFSQLNIAVYEFMKLEST